MAPNLKALKSRSRSTSQQSETGAIAEGSSRSMQQTDIDTGISEEHYVPYSTSNDSVDVAGQRSFKQSYFGFLFAKKDSCAVYKLGESPVYNTPKSLSARSTIDDVRLQHYRNRYGDRRFSMSLQTTTYSETSLLMMAIDSWYYFQHPYLKIFVAISIILLNTLNSSQDPISQSKIAWSNVPILGDTICFIILKYPPDYCGRMIKIAMWLLSICLGVFFGKSLFHGLILNRILRLKIFMDGTGSQLCMLFGVAVSIQCCYRLYNFIIVKIYEDSHLYLVNQKLYYQTTINGQVLAILTIVLDAVAVFAMTDSMLQDQLYPHWSVKLRSWWDRPNRCFKTNRILIFYVAIILTMLLSVFVESVIRYRPAITISYTFAHLNNELWRMSVNCVILILDLTMFLQDWEFPHFENVLDLKLPGSDKAAIHKLLSERITGSLGIHLTARIINYLALALVMFVNINCVTSTFSYTPETYAQYMHPEQQTLYGITDEYTLNHLDNKTLLSYSYRNTTKNPRTGRLYSQDDMKIGATYCNYSSYVKATFFIPVVLMLLIFLFLLLKYGRHPKPTKEDPYLGRATKANLILPSNIDQSCTAVLIRNPLKNLQRHRSFYQSRGVIFETTDSQADSDEEDDTELLEAITTKPVTAITKPVTAITKPVTAITKPATPAMKPTITFIRPSSSVL